MTSHLVLLAGGALFAGAYGSAWHAVQSGAAPADPIVGTPETRRLSEELDARRVVSLHRLALKTEATQALLRGAIDFREAVRQFREITVSDPAADARLRQLHPDVSETERYCRNVLSFVAGELSERPADEADAVIAALEAETAVILQEAMESECGGEQTE